MTNIICLLLLLITIFYAGAFYIRTFIGDSIIFFCATLLTLCTMYLTSKGSIFISKLLIVFLAKMLIFYVVIKMWFESQAHTFLVVFIASSFLLFNNIIIPILNLVLSAILYACSYYYCLLYTSPSPRDATLSRMPSSA